MSRKEKIIQLQREQSLRDFDKLNADTPAIPPHLSEQLKAIKPQAMHFHDDHIVVYPCLVHLNDRQVHPCTYLMTLKAATRCWWLKVDDSQKIDVRNIVTVENSPYRLPEYLARNIFGESRMGSLNGIFKFKDGRALPFLTVESLEFPMLPEGYSIADITNIKLHEDFGDKKDLVRSKPYVVAVFRDSSYAT
jgi:hypothetical protein